MKSDIEANIREIDNIIHPDESFDIIKRNIYIGGRRAALYFIDGFMKDAVFEKLMEFLYKLTPEQLSGIGSMEEFNCNYMPYTEADPCGDIEQVVTNLLSGPAVLLIDGLSEALLIDSRTYPTRSIEQPQKDRSLRGSKDGFVETLIINTSMIRRRIRDTRLRMEYHQIGKSSKVDLAIAYIDGLADKKLLKKIRDRIDSAAVRGISMTQEALSEVLVPTAFFNPFPKLKLTERPDFASACMLEGKIVVVMDNSPAVMVFPVSFADFQKEVNDYYFPTITGTYLRISRMLTSILTLLMMPVVLFFSNNREYLPKWLDFIVSKEEAALPLIAQFLILEFVVDALRLASLSTPDMLSNSIGVIGGLLLSEFAITAGWFLPQTILYVSFVTIASFAQPSFEMGFATKFIRVILLILTQLFGLWGLIGGIVLTIISMACCKTLSGRNYLYPIIPFNAKDFAKLFVRTGINNDNH